MIKTESLYKAYNGENVIKDITAELSPGKIYGLIGANGSGKTTFLKCLAGIYRPDSGRAMLDDTDIFDNEEIKSRIAYVGDTPEFWKFYTVKRYADYYAAFYDSFSYERFNELSERFETDKKSYAGNMSLGQRKKLALSLALSRDASHLIFDEPENGMDNEARVIFRQLIRDTADKGSLILLSSHDLTNIEGMCDEIIFLDKGRVIYKNDIDSLLENVSRWTVRSGKLDPGIAVIVEDAGDISTVIMRGNKESTRKILEAAGTEIITNDKVKLIDAYMAYRKETSDER